MYAASIPPSLPSWKDDEIVKLTGRGKFFLTKNDKIHMTNS